MTRRTRFVAGLLALLALTFSFAESVWASTCAPMTATGSEAMAMSTDAPVRVDRAPRGPRSGEGSHNDEDERPCPFGAPAATQTCTGVVTLPAPSSPLLAPPAEGPVSVFNLGTRTDRLLESSLFRPPRA